MGQRYIMAQPWLPWSPSSLTLPQPQLWHPLPLAHTPHSLPDFSMTHVLTLFQRYHLPGRAFPHALCILSPSPQVSVFSSMMVYHFILAPASHCHCICSLVSVLSLPLASQLQGAEGVHLSLEWPGEVGTGWGVEDPI